MDDMHIPYIYADELPAAIRGAMTPIAAYSASESGAHTDLARAWRYFLHLGANPAKSFAIVRPGHPPALLVHFAREMEGRILRAFSEAFAPRSILGVQFAEGTLRWYLSW